MNIEQFIAKYNGQHVDVDGYYGAQCWDLVARYAIDVVHCPSLPTVTGGASGLFTNTAPIILQYFDRIANNANDPNLIAQRGDIIVWSNSWSPPWGHTALVTGATKTGVTVLEQNGNDPNGGAYITTRNWTGVAGWLRPKQGGNTDVSKTDLSIARILAHGILGRLDAHSGATDGDLNANHVNKETNSEVWGMFKSAEGSQWRDIRLPQLLNADARAQALGTQLTQANTALAGLQQQITELGKRPTQTQLDQLTKSVTDANEKAMNAQADLEKLRSQNTTDTAVADTWLRRLGQFLSKYVPNK